MQIRDRVKGLRRVKAGLLKPHPRNWRTHPRQQGDALRGVLAEIGYAGALLARELDDGSLQLIDGHLRAQTTPDAEVPVLIVDLDDDEADKLLAVLDPLGAMAEANHDVLAGLLQDVETENEAVASLLDKILLDNSPLEDLKLPQDGPQNGPQKGPPPEVEIPKAFQVVVDCRDEAEQRTVYERLCGEGLRCRVMNL